MISGAFRRFHSEFFHLPLAGSGCWMFGDLRNAAVFSADPVPGDPLSYKGSKAIFIFSMQLDNRLPSIHLC
jgi:hypothetical protein